MAYQEVKTTSYGTRVGNSFKRIGGGLLVWIFAFKGKEQLKKLTAKATNQPDEQVQA